MTAPTKSTDGMKLIGKLGGKGQGGAVELPALGRHHTDRPPHREPQPRPLTTPTYYQHVQRTWWVHRDTPPRPELRSVAIRTLLAPLFAHPVSDALPVVELKAQLAELLEVSPRKELTLRWWGTPLDDYKLLKYYNLPDGGVLDLSLQTKSAQVIEDLKAVRQIRVRCMQSPLSDVHIGRCVMLDEGISAATDVASVKAQLTRLKAFGHDPKVLAPAEYRWELKYSQVFSSAFGVEMKDDTNLGKYGVLDGDVLYASLFPANPAALEAEKKALLEKAKEKAKNAPKKKDGGKKGKKKK